VSFGPFAHGPALKFVFLNKISFGFIWAVKCITGMNLGVAGTSCVGFLMSPWWNLFFTHRIAMTFHDPKSFPFGADKPNAPGIALIAQH
jgi:hypothetical protein